MAIDSRTVRGWCLLILGGVLGMLACSKSDPTDPGGPTGPTIRQVIGTTGWFPAVYPDSNAFAEVRFDSTGVASEPLRCTDYAGDQTREFEAMTMLAADADLQFPGAIMQWLGLQQITPTPVVADRAGGAISLTAAAGGTVAGTVDVMTGPAVSAWRLGALDELGTIGPGSWELVAGIVYDQDHLAMQAELDPAGMTAEALERLSMRDQGPGRVLLRLQRNHHTVTCPYPEDSRFAFAPDVTGSDLVSEMADGNPPVWLESVDYGELLLVLVEAEAEDAEVFAAAVNSFTAAAEDRAPDPTALLVHDLPGVAMSVFAVGADADAAEVAAAASLDELTEFLQTAPVDPAALPGLTTGLLALRNGGSITFGVSTAITFTGCEIYEPVLDQVLWSFEVADAHTEFVLGDLDTNGEGDFYYDGSTTQFPEELIDFIPDLVGQGGYATPIGRRPFLLRDALNGRPAAEVYEVTIDDGTIYSELRFDGSAIVGRDYTIVIVCGLPRRVYMQYTIPGGIDQISQTNSTNFFLHGTGTGQRHNMKLGYPDRDWMIYSHEPYLLQADHQPEPDEWHVYAVTFGVDTGMALYYDGELIDSDPSDTYPLLEFSNATICSRWRNYLPIAQGIFWFAEISAYQGAADAATILDETRRLDEKYDLGLVLDP